MELWVPVIATNRRPRVTPFLLSQKDSEAGGSRVNWTKELHPGGRFRKTHNHKKGDWDGAHRNIQLDPQGGHICDVHNVRTRHY